MNKMAKKNLLQFFKRCIFSEEEAAVLEGAVTTKVEANQEHRILRAHAEFPMYVPFSHIVKLKKIFYL